MSKSFAELLDDRPSTVAYGIGVTVVFWLSMAWVLGNRVSGSTYFASIYIMIVVATLVTVVSIGLYRGNGIAYFFAYFFPLSLTILMTIYTVFKLHITLTLLLTWVFILALKVTLNSRLVKAWLKSCREARV